MQSDNIGITHEDTRSTRRLDYRLPPSFDSDCPRLLRLHGVHEQYIKVLVTTYIAICPIGFLRLSTVSRRGYRPFNSSWYVASAVSPSSTLVSNSG